MYSGLIQDEFNETMRIMKIFMNNKDCISAIQSSDKLMANAFRMGKKILSCGNGSYTL